MRTMLLSTHSLFMYITTLSLFCLNRSVEAAATGQGSVSLFSDSGCDDGYSYVFSEPVTIALNLTLAADTCHSLSRAAHSYEVDRHPTCDDGTPATFEYYEFTDCHDRRPRTEGVHRPNDNAGKFDGVCLALVEFTSLAFLCNGVKRGGDGSSSVASSTSQASSTSAAPETVTVTLATPVAPGSSLTAPLYIVPGTVAPAGTGTASGQPLPTGGTVPPAPSPFVAAGSTSRASLLGTFAAIIARLLL